ncbi:MAG: hypothetical protein FK734_16525 [Asgard group archaeon]|nr:hypothetical protein [Asgard group archaeon]
MKTAICAFCAQTGMLCKDCQTKLNSGEIAQVDVDIAKIAIEYEKTHPEAAKAAILQIIDKPDVLLVLVSPGSLRLLVGGSKDFDKRLERFAKKSVKLLEKTKNIRKVVDDLFSPAVITGINTVFVPLRNPKPGQSSIEEEQIVVLSPSEKTKLPAPVNELIKFVKLITGEEIRVEFR